MPLFYFCNVKCHSNAREMEIVTFLKKLLLLVVVVLRCKFLLFRNTGLLKLRFESLKD